MLLHLSRIGSVGRAFAALCIRNEEESLPLFQRTPGPYCQQNEAVFPSSRCPDRPRRPECASPPLNWTSELLRSAKLSKGDVVPLKIRERPREVCSSGSPSERLYEESP